MSSALVVHDDSQLHRIDSALAEILRSSPAAQRRAACLLAALESEKVEILQARSGKPQRHRLAIAA